MLGTIKKLDAIIAESEPLKKTYDSVMARKLAEDATALFNELDLTLRSFLSDLFPKRENDAIQLLGFAHLQLERAYHIDKL